MDYKAITSHFNTISKDIIINILANLLPVVILQLIVLPTVATRLGDEGNGLFLTILAILHFIIPVTSSTLSTARLLLDKDYQKQKKGDFNLWLSIYSLVNIIVIVVGCLIYSKTFSSFDILIISILSLIWMIRDYLLVAFRLSLNYDKILLNNTILAIGLFLGIIIFKYISLWYVIFLCGYCLAFIHALLSTTIIQEPIKKTSFFLPLSNTIVKLTSASILGMLAANLDRLLLFPLAGGTLVSIYYSASIIGKMMMLISSPISNVFLSYFVKVEHLKKAWLQIIFLITFGIGILTYIIVFAVSPFLLDWLYPSWSEESMQYVPITSAISSVELIIAVTTPMVLRFCGVNYQVKIQTIYFIFYVIGGMLLYHYWGLLGFAIGVLIASIIKVILIYCYAIHKNRFQIR